MDSIVAGAAIGIGALVYNAILVKGGSVYAAALCFFVGLYYVKLAHLPLITGMNQKLVRGEISWRRWIGVLVGNLVGAAIVGAFGGSFMPSVAAPSWGLFGGAVVTGALMTFATREKEIRWCDALCVGSFLLAGFPHCVAVAAYVKGWEDLVSLGVVILGNLVGGVLVARRV